MEVGSETRFNKQTLFVYQAKTFLKGTDIIHQYTLTPRKGLSQNNIYNQRIAGVSIGGKVIDVVKDKVRVHLEIDENQNKDEAHWFPYSTTYTAEGNSGLFFMPELNDFIMVYFPENKENEGVALCAKRQNSQEGDCNKIGDPDVKVLRTKSGKEMRFSPEEIVLSAKDGEVFIRINEKNGIEIHSKLPVVINSKEGIKVDSQKKITFSAAEEIDLVCKDSHIQMEGFINIKGKKVKTN